MAKVKITHSQNRSIQIKQYEPHNVAYTVEVELDVDHEKIPAELESLKKVVDEKLYTDIFSLKKTYEEKGKELGLV